MRRPIADKEGFRCSGSPPLSRRTVMTPTLTTCNSHRAGRLADFILEHGRELAAQCGKLKRLRLWADLTLRPPIEEAVS